MADCREITVLISRAMVRRLPWHKMLSLKIHLVFCKICFRFRNQLISLRTGVEKLSLKQPDGPDAVHLSEASRSRIRKTLKQRQD
jgi:hypothetical protein